MIRTTFLVLACSCIALQADTLPKGILQQEELQYTKIPEQWQKLQEIIPFETLKSIDEIDILAITANLNDYSDKLFANLQTQIINRGLDPFEMPEMHEGFNYTLIIRYHGEIDLSKGWLSDIATIHRGGDVILSYDTAINLITLTIPIAFNDMQFSYDYSLKFMGLGPRGGIEGKAANVKANVVLNFDTAEYRATLARLDIDSGHISFHFTGNVLTDWILNIISEVVTTILKRVILFVLNVILGGIFNGIIDAINNAVGGILHPSTTTTQAPIEDIVQHLIKNLR